jgi:hypothetical protein
MCLNQIKVSLIHRMHGTTEGALQIEWSKCPLLFSAKIPLIHGKMEKIGMVSHQVEHFSFLFTLL